MYYCYILKSIQDQGLYIGYTQNVSLRLQEHHSGNVRSTKSRRPLKLIFYAAFLSKYDALAAEKYYKTTAGHKRIQRMLAHTLPQEIT